MNRFAAGCDCCNECCEGVDLEANLEVLAGATLLPGNPVNLSLTIVGGSRQYWEFKTVGFPITDPSFQFTVQNVAPLKFACEWGIAFNVRDSTATYTQTASVLIWRKLTCNPFRLVAILAQYGDDLDGDGLGDVAAVVRATVTEIP